MNTRYSDLAKLSAVALTFTLVGCLSSGSSDTASFAEDPPPPPSGNSAPTISGNPGSAVTVGDNYSFTPTASDADGDTLTFSIQNQPVWASFNSNTGRLSGQPTLGDIGSFAGIVISVSDGQASASMGGFSIDVTQVATSSTTLNWTAPTLNEDGSTLTDLAGYKIYYGRSPGSYTNEITIDNPSVTTYLVDNLTPDTYYFVATAVDVVGTESRYSGEYVTTVN
jgi:hypothetical protein